MFRLGTSLTLIRFIVQNRVWLQDYQISKADTYNMPTHALYWRSYRDRLERIDLSDKLEREEKDGQS